MAYYYGGVSKKDYSSFDTPPFLFFLSNLIAEQA